MPLTKEDEELFKKLAREKYRDIMKKRRDQKRVRKYAPRNTRKDKQD